MNIGLAFGFVFKDKDWFKKVLFPALCGLIPVIGQLIIVGWGLKAAKKVIDGYEEDALPELEFGADLGRGFLASLITAIYSIPIAIIAAITGGLFSWGASATEDVFGIILMILGGCLGLIGLLVGILLAFMGVAGVANFIAKGTFGAAFKFKDVFGMVKKSFVSWLLLIVIQSLVISIIAPLGAVACGVGATNNKIPK